MKTAVLALSAALLLTATARADDPKPRRNVAIFVYEGVELLDFAGPGEVFASAGGRQAFKVYTVAATKAPIKAQGFLTVTPEFSIEDCPKPDVIVLPGGLTRAPMRDPKVIDWIKTASANTEVTMSVCTGAFLLAKAGLLDGREATTHWGFVEQLKSASPSTKVRADKRVVDTCRVVTTAGVSAGIDGSLHVVQRLLGEQAARDTARSMEYKWETGPAGGK